MNVVNLDAYRLVREFPAPSALERERIQYNLDFQWALLFAEDPARVIAPMGVDAIEWLQGENDLAASYFDGKASAYREIAAEHEGIISPELLAVFDHQEKEMNRARDVLVEAHAIASGNFTPSAS